MMGGQQNEGGMGKQGSQQNIGKGGQQAQGQGKQGAQSEYWRQQFQSEPYYQQGKQFEDYEQAYSTGEQGRAQYGSSSQNFQDNEQSLKSDYENNTRGQKNAMSWDQGASQACRAAWDRAGSQSSDRDMQGGSQSGKQGGSQAGSSDTNRRNS
jgi:hypothetical protein